MKTKNLLKEKIKIYTGFIKDGRVPADGYYKKDLDSAKKLLKIIEDGKLTPKKFNKLSIRDKWDIADSKLLKNIEWCCNRCGLEQGKTPPRAPFFEGDSIVCSNCDNELTRRTNGGQSNPFNMTFKKIKSKA